MLVSVGHKQCFSLVFNISKFTGAEELKLNYGDVDVSVHAFHEIVVSFVSS